MASRITPRHCDASDYFLPTPSLHITDPDGYLPLELARDGLTRDYYGFEKDLSESIMMDYIARVLVGFPENPDGETIKAVLESTWFKSSKGGIATPGCLLNKDGFCLPFQGALNGKLFRSLLYLDDTIPLKMVPDLQYWDCIVIERDFGISFFTPKIHRYERVFRRLSNRRSRINVEHFRFTDNYLESQYGSGGDAYPYDERKWCCNGQWVTKEPRKDGYEERLRWLVESKGFEKSKFPFERLIPSQARFYPSSPFVVDLLLREPWQQKLGSTLLDRWWTRFFGFEWVPWKLSERRRRFPQVFNDLQEHIAQHGG